MKIALAQMSMTADIAENLKKSLAYCDEAAGCDLLFFPEIQLSPFFPQYEKKNVDAYAMGEDAEALRLLAQKAGEHHYYLSPNVYLERNGHRYDASLWIGPDGQCSTPPSAKSASRSAMIATCRRAFVPVS